MNCNVKKYVRTLVDIYKIKNSIDEVNFFFNWNTKSIQCLCAVSPRPSCLLLFNEKNLKKNHLI